MRTLVDTNVLLDIITQDKKWCSWSEGALRTAAEHSTVGWSQIEPTIHPGDPGTATWRTREVGNVRVRMVEYSPGYVADHWCERGHVVHVLEGALGRLARFVVGLGAAATCETPALAAEVAVLARGALGERPRSPA